MAKSSAAKQRFRDTKKSCVAGSEAEAQAQGMSDAFQKLHLSAALARLAADQDWASPRAGKLWLVGAGPGDPELLTVKALRLLQSADVIVHDRLVSRGILDVARADAERIFVGKTRGNHSLPQDEINALLVAKANAGLQVVRLKGGDPFIFGRGGEEMEAARAAGVAVEIVPGITAALGCAAQAQLPLTHRDHASAVTFVAGQCRDLHAQDWRGLASETRTLVIYMGLNGASDIAGKLIADGLAPDMPVAIIENGTRRTARVLQARLDALADVVQRHGVASPALLVVGRIAALARKDEREAALQSLSLALV